MHTHITDELDSAHPLAFEQVECERCKVLVHAANNECMQTWFEVDGEAICSACFKPLIGEVMTTGMIDELLGRRS